MPLGLSNAAQTFQLFMGQVLGGVPVAYTHIGNALIVSPIPKQHLKELQTVFYHITMHSIVINPK